ncbi:MAG: chromosomal replication initiator protein DnaA [Syntrophales bacterium]|nr:chromosomal replication initiator protein DnaA [Syntrophales bacterium]
MDQIWKEALKLIKENISQQNFDIWIKPIRLAEIKEEEIKLSVPNRFFKEWIEENYLPLLKDSLKVSTGRTYELSFVFHDDTPPLARENENRVSHSIGNNTNRREISRRTHPQLNEKYSFERFVVGPSNQLAHAAAISVAEQPAKNYNPLFIYGGVGLGKTHLLNAIGLRTFQLYNDMNIVYVSAEAFMNELVHSIRCETMSKFREKYRNVECLLIDDIQFIAGKERTQEEFFHTFNTLHDAGKQIVVTSDKFPRDIPNLESRLRSRFEWGLIADIQPPDLETKIAIIMKKAQENNINLPDSVAYYIAEKTESNIREMEGFLLRIVAYASLKQRPIDLELARDVLKHMINQKVNDDISIEDVLKVVASKTGIKVSDIKSPKKNKNIAFARQLAMFMARRLTPLSFPDIGQKIGNRDHSTVIYACSKWERMMEEDMKLRKLVEEIEEAIHQRR